MKLTPMVVLILNAAVLSSPAFGQYCPEFKGFRQFTAADVKQCAGETFKLSTGKQKVPKVGFAIGGDNPKCGSKIKDVIYGINWDGSGSPTPSISEGGEYDKVKCKRVTVRLPPNATICGIRYWASSAKKKRESKTLKEREGLRNTGREERHNWAWKCPTLIKPSASGQEIRVVYKNWRASYARYFQFEVEYQPASKPQASRNPTGDTDEPAGGLSGPAE